MIKVKTIKDIFDERIDKDIIRKNVLKKIDNKRDFKKLFILKLSLGAILIMCCLFIVNNNQLLKTKVPTLNDNNNIIINKLNNMSQFKIDADVQIINGLYIPDLEVLQNLNIPKRLDKMNGAKIYTRNGKTGDYNIFANYEFSYFNDDNWISIALSDTNKPVRDYYFEEVGTSSTINNINLIIYKYQDAYLTEFIYKGYNFDIETSGITEEELISLLESLIK